MTQCALRRDNMNTRNGHLWLIALAGLLIARRIIFDTDDDDDADDAVDPMCG